MKVLLVSGSFPPESCGVGDFTNTLYHKLTIASYPVQIIKKVGWGMSNIIAVYKAICQQSPDLIHIQYPTAGYGYSLLPQLFSLLFPSVVTLHEFSQTNILRRLSLFFFTLRSSLIFTTSDEQDRFCRFYFWLDKTKTAVIPIGSNIEIDLSDSVKTQNTSIISYFGLIRPDKGLEDVIELASLLKKAQSPFTIRIIGKTISNLDYYTQHSYNLAKDLPIDWCLDLPDEVMALRFAESSFMYLPFPDGASIRRGSLLAALSHGILTLTTEGIQTPSDMGKAVLYVKSPQDVLSLLVDGSLTDDIRAYYKNEAITYSNKFAWPNIIAQHIALYEKFFTQR